MWEFLRFETNYYTAASVVSAGVSVLGAAAHAAHSPASFTSTFSVPHPEHVPIIKITSLVYKVIKQTSYS